MQNLAKRHWGHSIGIKDAADIMIDWCVRARDKNILRKKPPQIFFSYILDDTPPLQYFHNISPVFKYSQKDVPYIDQTRDCLLRCLSVALKAHFFLFPQAKVLHEPYFFVFPSLVGETSIGLIYTTEDKTIVVCEKDLKMMFDNCHIVCEFPTVVIEDSFRWYHMKNWAKLKQLAHLDDNHTQINHTQGSSSNHQAGHIHHISHAQMAKDASSVAELQKYSTIVEVPYEIKDIIKPLGIEWSNKVKTWYLPKGFDVDSIREFIEYSKKDFAKNNTSKSAS